MLGDVLLRRSDRLRQFLHARLPEAEPVEQLDPHWFGEDAKPTRDQLDQVVIKRVPDNQRLATIGLLAGFMLMLPLDNAFA